MLRKLLVVLLFAGLQLPAVSPATENTLHVMLQGGSSPDLSALVERHGGSITHELPIIDAVGANLSPEQLAAVLESPLVLRYIDDLLVSDPEDSSPSDKAAECEVEGALELEIAADRISWPLYNLKSPPATLKSLVFSWPVAQLGAVNSISLGGTKIDTGSMQTGESGKMTLPLGKHRPVRIETRSDLVVNFAGGGNQKSTDTLRQQDFSIEVAFYEDCSTKLLPAYEDNHNDFYYSTVAGADALHRHGITGAGVTVAVLDSGLWDHEALTNNTSGEARVLARYDAIKNTSNQGVFDESGHGSHMTSIIAHSGATLKAGKETGGFKGIAPDVDLVAIKAFDVEGQGDLLDIVRGIQWAVDNREKYDIKVLNLSFAARPRWDYWQDPINQAVMRAWASGITVVAAAGNEGPDDMTIGSPGNLPYIITVGAFTDSWTVADRSDDYIPDFSSRGPTPNAHIKPDIVAPGGHITGVTRPGSTIMKEHPGYALRTGEFVMTGSSQASALVSGIAALLLQLEPQLTPDDVKCKLISSAEPAINADGLLAYSPFQQGHGQVNATRAVTLGRIGCANSDLDIEKDMSGIEHYQGPAIVDDDGAVSLPGLTRMVSPEPSEKGRSETRKWGVKAHIERDPTPVILPPGSPPPTIKWQELYDEERARIERLANNPQVDPDQPRD